jgi:3-(3-hydroxy-phenyl)propionate hydroxylase
VQHQVIVIGAGPVGLTTALLLASHGVRVAVLEKGAAPACEARAVSLDDECLRIWQACGLESALREDWAGGEPGSVICAYRGRRGRPFLTIRQREGDLGYPHAVVIHQGRINAKLLHAAMTRPTISVFLGREATAVTEERAGVVVSGNGPDGGPFSLRAPWVVACDGGGSPVRRALGVEMIGVTLPNPWLIADFEDAGGPQRVVIGCHPRDASVTLPLPHGVRRIERMLAPDDDGAWIDDDAVVRERLAAVWPGARDAPIRNRTVRRFGARVAARWRVGRVFLAGDAAHVSPPFAGQGMAAGLRDAANLAFKLAGVCQGWLPESILDTYEQERRPHQRRMDLLARRLGRLMAPRSALEAICVQSALRSLARSRAVRRRWMLRGPEIRPRLTSGFLRPTGLAGRYLPQPWVVVPGIGRARLDAVLGQRMTWIALGAHREPGHMPADLVGPSDTVLAEGRDFHDADHALRRAFGAGSLLLVRPDRIVHTHIAQPRKAMRGGRTSPWSHQDAPRRGQREFQPASP